MPRDRIRVGLLLFFFLSLLHVEDVAAQGNAAAGQELWASSTHWCRNCHGPDGEGGFGPDLAGRQLSLDQFRRAVREPWGVMLAFTEEWVTDQDLADILAYLDTLPSVSELGSWRTPIPAGAPLGQQLAIATAGCSQCHGAALTGPRMDIGGISADFEWFKKQVYEHTTMMPEHRALLGEPNRQMRMGNYSRARLPESVLEEIWRFTVGLGPRAYVTARMSPGELTENGVTHMLTVNNGGLPGRGLRAEDVTITVVPAAGVTVANATGPGYQGVQRDPQANADAAVWTVPSIGPREEHLFSITLSGTPVDGAGNAAIAAAEVRWARPQSEGGGDRINVGVPRPAPAP